MIPQDTQIIGERAFTNCRFLTSVTIPDSVTTIESLAFYDCENLVSCLIPKSVTFIDRFAFSGCSNLTLSVYRDSYAAGYCEDEHLPYAFVD